MQDVPHWEEVHEDLVITLVGIHDAGQLMACGSIDKLITSEKRVVVLGASSIYINIVLAHVSHVVWFLDHD